MHLYNQIYEFAASVGALEGYVYHKKSVAEMDMKALHVWTGNLVDAYDHLPADVLDKVQPSLDLTLNRAISSFNAILEKDHQVLERLNSMISREKECSPDDFQKKKWFQE
ncbi:hypothetical protein [Desulfobacula toluolica]|uniref:hypothetical protein n=1 Tax=Desulfobacula toluolica TaxID=28223 RepID=UPI00059EB01F|nr:hypothetical protein [Desulfobacula toluolica]